MSTPYIGFGNDQIDSAPALGGTITCPHCGEVHSVKSRTVDGTTLHFYGCGDEIYLAGMNGKNLIHTEPISGRI